MLRTLLFLSLIWPAAWAEILDLGDVSQYKAPKSNQPLSGKSIRIQGSKSEGFDVQLSPETATQVRSRLDKCSVVDNKCFTGVTAVLKGADLQMAGEEEKRQVLVVAGVVAIVGIVIAYHSTYQKDNHEEILPGPDIHIPDQKANQASLFTGQTPVTVSAAGSPVITITPTPAPTSLRGSKTPSVIPITTAVPGYRPGDFMATLDKSLASRLDEIMHRGQECDDGRSFDAHPGARKRAGASLGQAICAAEAAVRQAQPGGPLSDLLLMQAPAFRINAGDVANAARVVVDFVRENAAAFAIDAALAPVLGDVLLLLAIETVMDKTPLDQQNLIDSSLINTSGAKTTAATSTSSCAHPSACEAACDGVGANFYSCTTTCTEVTTVCATGTESNSVRTTTTRRWNYPTAALTATATPTQTRGPECSGGANRSPFPARLFQGPEHSVIGKFCNEVKMKPGNKLSWTVDSAGNPLSGLTIRAPPPSPKQYKDFKVRLDWQPKGDQGGKCQLSCADAYTKIAGGDCGGNSGTTYMTAQGKWDIGCGTYGWEILAPPPPGNEEGRTLTPLAEGPVHCYDADARRYATNAQELWPAAYAACASGPVILGPGERRWDKAVRRGGAEMLFSIEWARDCRTTVEEQSPRLPYGNRDGKSAGVECPWFMVRNWEDCKSNEGMGGWRQVGCLIYSYRPGEK